MTLEHFREDAIRQLVEMKHRIDDTIKMIDSADDEKDFLLALVNSPMLKHGLDGD